MKKLSVDMVVIGGGGAGMSAALSAFENGVKNIVILEKLAAPGGNSLFPPPPFKNGVPDFIPEGEVFIEKPTQEKANSDFTDMVDWTHWRINASLIRALVRKQADTCSWLAGKLEDKEEWGRNKGGTAKLLIPWCEKYGIPIMCSTRAKELRTDEMGRITGVVAENKEETLEFECKAVVIATGGFIGNKELMKRFFPFWDGEPDEMFIFMGYRHEGDGLMLAESVGAAFDNLAVEWGTLRFKQRAGSGVAFLANSHYFPQPIWLNPEGERFANETAQQAQNAVLSLPGLKHFAVFDSNSFEIMKRQGIEKSIGGGEVFEKIEQDFDAETEYGFSGIFQTLEELAKWIGAKPEKLSGTLDRYNQFCENGRDEDFLRNPATMFPISKPPFYAMRLRLAPLLTRGPIHVNGKLEAISKLGHPIAGLYSAGSDIGGTDNDVYNVKVLGHSMRWAVTSGLIAGESTAEYIKSEEM